MDLFDDLLGFDPTHNYLPFDGTVNYFGQVIEHALANEYYQALLTQIAWQHDQAMIFGKQLTTKRKVAWYADQAFSYTYSNITKTALPWTEVLLELKVFVEQLTQEKYNSCLLNLYHSGEEGMAWHSDAERDLKRHAAIASLSFGAQRKFCFKHKRSQEKIDFNLAHGGLLVMKGTTQSHWLHRLPPTKQRLTPRINLTFRMIEVDTENDL